MLTSCRCPSITCTSLCDIRGSVLRNIVSTNPLFGIFNISMVRIWAQRRADDHHALELKLKKILYRDALTDIHYWNCVWKLGDHHRRISRRYETIVNFCNERLDGSSRNSTH